MLLLLVSACHDTATPRPATTPLEPVPWSSTRSPLEEHSPAGLQWQRGLIHLHSHYSHDACDGEPMPGGVPDEACLQHLRDGLCNAGMDFAFITDHPAHAAEQPYQDLLLNRPGDSVVDGRANTIPCADHTVLTLPGIEDELMPIGLKRHVAEDAASNDALYNASDDIAITALIDAGGLVLQAHTEGQDLDTLYARQAAGQAGVEIFNLHAMFDPNKREDDLGLDGLAYLEDLGPFVSGINGAEPDLAFLTVHQEQTVSLERWDALNRVAPSVGVAGTDAHENVLPSLMSDGERMDSYRRMMSWFSNIVLVDGDGPEALTGAVAAGRLFLAFESLGTPSGFSVSYAGLEMGGTAPTGETLSVSCPTLAPTSPTNLDTPEITVEIFRDSALWQTGCGEYVLSEPGVYRVRVSIVPWHLRDMMGTVADTLIHSYPWLYSNAFRVGL